MERDCIIKSQLDVPEVQTSQLLQEDWQVECISFLLLGTISVILLQLVLQMLPCPFLYYLC